MAHKTFTCAGLPASWLNAWLAALGATVLDKHQRLRLHWTDEASPKAVLSATGDDPLDVIVESWPAKDDVKEFPLAKKWRGTDGLVRKVTVESFVARAKAARGHPQAWMLSSTMTDLCLDGQEVAHARLDPAGPGTIKWLHHRLEKVHDPVEQLDRERLSASFHNLAPRVADNGLGFDQSRIASLADETEKWVDPIVEVLAFFGLFFLPVRGSGHETAKSPEQRNWLKWPSSEADKTQRQAAFLWPAWSQPLDRDGIDALLDAWAHRHGPNICRWKRGWHLLGVHSAWRTVQYQSRAQADPTRALGSERL